MSVIECFQKYLMMSENSLKICVDLYNAGHLTANARLALEAIEGCDGPGDQVIASVN
jgi:hypothetical protein